MLARLLRLSLLVQVTAGAALALWLLPTPARYWLALPAGLLVPVIGTAIVLAGECIIGAVADPRQPRASIGNALRVWLHETLVSVRAFSWRQAWFADFPEPSFAHDSQRPAVLLIHGYVCNRAAWKPLLDSGLLRDCNVATLNLEPVFADIDSYTQTIADAIDNLRNKTGAQQVILICHSMGGLAVRCYLRKFGDAYVARVMTIATPHHGTIFGAVGQGRNARQMAVGSAFLADLLRAYTPELALKFVCVATRDDNLIVPRSSPLLPGSQHHIFEGTGHLAMIEDARVWQLICEVVRPIPTLPSPGRGS